jgi:hypothetical protein
MPVVKAKRVQKARSTAQRERKHVRAKPFMIVQEAIDRRLKTSFRGKVDADGPFDLGERRTIHDEATELPPATRSITYVMCNYLPLRIRLVRYPNSGASYFHRRYSP